MRVAAIVVVVLLSAGPASNARADCNFDSVSSQLEGYTLLGKKTIKGTFNGCNFNAAIVFTDGPGVHCVGYDYIYAFQPDVLLFGRGANYKMCVESELIDIQP